MRIILVTCPPSFGPVLLRHLVGERLVAGGNIIPGVRSLYHWKGEVNDDPEEVLLMETSVERVSAMMARILDLHPYDVPKILAFDPKEAPPEYLKWVEEETVSKAIPESRIISGPRRILIRGLVLAVSIGIFPEERLSTQRVRIDVEASMEDAPPGTALTIDDTVSYATLVEGIHGLIGRGHIDLVETFAGDIAALCMADLRVFHTRVRVEKLDVIKEAEGVGVEVERRRVSP